MTLRIQQSPQQEQIPRVLISFARPDLNPKAFFLVLLNLPLLCCGPLPSAEKPALEDGGGSGVKVTKVVCSVYYLHSGPGQLGQEGKGLSALKELCLQWTEKVGLEKQMLEQFSW